MKKSLKGIILASLISTQVLAAPISALAVTAETTETSETAPQPVEEPKEEVVAPKPGEESTVTETPNKEESTDTTVEEGKKPEETPAPEETPTTPTTPPTEEKPTEKPAEKPGDSKVVASEAKKQAVRAVIADAQATLDAGTYTGESIAPLTAAMAAATTLLAKEGVTDAELDAAIADIAAKKATLVKADVELSFLLNLISAVEEGKKILNNADEFKDIYTPASVAARKAAIQAAVAAGESLLASLVVGEKIDPSLAIPKEADIRAAADAIINAIHSDGGLVRRDHMAEILAEADKLVGSNAATLQDKEAFEAAVAAAVDAYNNALTDKELDDAINALRAAMNNLQLAVIISAVDENGTLIMDETTITGTYKSAWSVTPPAVEGYEFVSASSLARTAFSTASSGTFGDGTNKVTLVYKKVAEGVPTPVPTPQDPSNSLQKPVVIGASNDKAKKNVTDTKKKLPQTGEETSAVASLGFVALAAGALAFFKKRKIEE